MTFDYETRHYTNLTGYFSLFGDRKLHLCGTNFYGYVQDVSDLKFSFRYYNCSIQIVISADNRQENLIQNCIRNPTTVEYDPSVGWNNRAAIPERKNRLCI